MRRQKPRASPGPQRFRPETQINPAVQIDSTRSLTGVDSMTWIKTISMEDDERVKKAMLAQRAVYPIEYATPVHPENNGESSSIVASHSLIPDALFHAFSTFGALFSPELPLQRRQHEMIATMVSVANRCVY